MSRAFHFINCGLLLTIISCYWTFLPYFLSDDVRGFSHDLKYVLSFLLKSSFSSIARAVYVFSRTRFYFKFSEANI